MVARSLGLFSLALLCVVASKASASITYRVSPSEATRPGWSFDGGYITTDGTLGDISPLNFESWEMRFTSPAGQSEISSTNGGAFLIKIEYTNLIYNTLVMSPSLYVTHDEIIASSSNSGNLRLIFSDQDILLDAYASKSVSFFPAFDSRVVFVGGMNSSFGYLIDNTIDPSDPIGTSYTSPGSISNGSAIDFPAGPIVIGSVATSPEPNSIALCGLCLVLSSQCFRRRNTAS